MVVIHMLLNKQFILASNSVSRKMLLKNAGLNFFSKKPLCDEDYIKDQLLKKNTKKTNLPKLLAEVKALSVSKNNTKYLVVGSDTIILFNNTIINKAKTMEEAKKNNSPLPITKIIDDYYAEVQKMGGQRWDTSSLIKRFRK